MGKATRWFRGLLGFKKSESSTASQPTAAPSTAGDFSAHSKPHKKKWSFVKSYQDHRNGLENNPKFSLDDRRHSNDTAPASSYPASSHDSYTDDPNKHAIAVAAATAAVADAAVAAARAAATVVKLTSSGRSTTTGQSGKGVDTVAFVNGSGRLGVRDRAAVKIQSHYRAYLAKRALRALRALVKLQALVRGHIIRKRNVDELHKIQVLLRARSSAKRAQIPNTPCSVTKTTHLHYLTPVAPEKCEYSVRAEGAHYDQSMILKRSSSKTNRRVYVDHGKAKTSRRQLNCANSDGISEAQAFSTINFPIDDYKSDRIQEVDSAKQFVPKCRSLFKTSHLSLSSDQYSHSFTTSKDSVHQNIPSPSSGEVQSFDPLMYSEDVEEGVFFAAGNSPQFYSASSEGGSSRRALFSTPTKSCGSRSCLSGYLDHPSYMAYTESAKAKMRSLSTPKQRPAQFERSSSTNRNSMHGYNDTKSSVHRVSTLHGNLSSKAYPGSGRLDKLGMPVQGDVVGFSGVHWIRY